MTKTTITAETAKNRQNRHGRLLLLYFVGQAKGFSLGFGYWTRFFSSNFSGTPGISRTYRAFWAPAPSRGRPPPHPKISDQKVGFGFLFLAWFSLKEIWPDQAVEAEFSVQVVGIRVASGFESESPGRVRIVDRGFYCRGSSKTVPWSRWPPKTKKVLSNPSKGSIEPLRRFYRTSIGPQKGSTEPQRKGFQNHREGSIEPFASNSPFQVTFETFHRLPQPCLPPLFLIPRLYCTGKQDPTTPHTGQRLPPEGKVSCQPST